jgi:TRAP-type C4-dicarboxylate transport system substrate-binding protein
MMKKLLAFVLIVGLIFVTGSALAQTATIKIGSHTPPKSGHISKGVAPWCRAVEKDSGGTLKFKEFWGGQLTRSPRKQYELLMNGIQDATIVLPSYTQELFPDFTLFSLPYLFRNAREGSIVQWRMYEMGFLRGLDDVYVAAVYNNGNSLLHFSKKVNTADDIKGKKIRAAGPEEAAVIKAMGGIPVGMSITQVAESLNRGVIQGSLSGWSAARSFRFLPLVKTHYEEPLGVRSFFLGINKKVYDKLPEKAKQAIKKNSGLVLSRRIGGDLFDAEIKALRQGAVDDPKRNIVTVSEADGEKRFATLFKPFHDEWIKNTPDGQKKYDALMKILAEVRQGR